MSRRARLGASIASVALIAISLGACSRFDDQPVQVAAKAVASDCVVGGWRQSEGWQRVSTSDIVTDLRLISGGRIFQVNADGTARVEYANPTLWKNDGSGAQDLEVVYAGTSTLTYTAKDGDWNETADATKVTTTLTLNGTKDIPRPGTANRASKATYRCDEKNLIITADTTRQAYTRT